MMTNLGTTRVDEIMSSVVFSVNAKDKIADVATRFDQQDVNAAPVVNDANECIGIITSHDLVEYESNRSRLVEHLDHGMAFDLAHYSDRQAFPLLRVPIDQVGIQMSTAVETVAPHTSLSEAAQRMCTRHIHHLVILDSQRHPVGMLSALDILGFLTGVVIARNRNLPTQPDGQ